MDVEQDEKRLRPQPYGSSSTSHQQRMQPPDPGSHNYPNPSGSGSNYVPAPVGWAPPPSPFTNHPRQTSQLAQQSAPYPPAGRENTFAPEVPYDNRAGSISVSTRSPDAIVHANLQQVNGSVSDTPFQSQSEYRNRGGYAPPDIPPNVGQPPNLQVSTATGQEVMPGHPPFAQTPHGPYPHPQSAGPAPGPSPIYDLYPGQHWSNSPMNRKKPVRAQQACDSCRTRKAKCDEARPCSHCKDNQLTCTYREIPPHKQDRNQIALEAKIDGLQRDMNEKWTMFMQAWESLQNKEIKVPPEGSSSQTRATDGTPTQEPSSSWAPSQAPASTDGRPGSTQVAPSQLYTSANTQEDERNTLPHRHTTAAQNLLLWPSIAAFRLEADPDYVMTEEVNRGMLRCFGRGVSRENLDGSPGLTSPGDGSTTSRTADSPSPPVEPLWGYGFKAPCLSHQGYPADHPGGLNPDGTPNYAADLVDRFFESYMRHMHILHPFLDKKVIRNHVNEFKSRYSRERPTLYRKRKLDEQNPPSAVQQEAGGGATGGSHVLSVERSMKNAIVILVLALGKICDHKTPLPASPPTSSAITASTSGSTPHSVSDRQDGERLNVDVIPGLAYYNVACDILGSFRGGYELSNVQAALLAGLYMGQLAQVRASHDWITQGGKACQALITRIKFYECEDSQYLDLVKYAYWSCVQLESDILAELPLPQSGITRDEGLMNDHLPSGIHYHDDDRVFYQTDAQIMEVKYYWSQIQLRKTLNTIHKLLYKDNYLARPVLHFKVQEILRENLEEWRRMSEQINPELAWDDDDYVTSDINAARMRGKYYGAKVIVNRPSLYAALHEKWSTISISPTESRLPISSRPLAHESIPASQQYHATGVPVQGSYVDSTRPEDQRTLDQLRPEIRYGVEATIHAAIRSTTAFDGVPPRLIVTNIFGTAHAQFGNMLTLSAAYNSYLRPLIDGVRLRGLLKRTIQFLCQSADISPSLRRDMQLLIKLEARLFPSCTGGGRP